MRDGLPGERVTSPLEDHAGQLWVGIDNVLYVYDKGELRRIKRPESAPIGPIIAIAEDQDNNVWAEAIGNPAKLVRIQDREVREEIPAPRVPTATSLAADPKDGIWLGLANGALARYRHGQLETFPIRSGMAAVMRQILVRADGSALGASSAGLVEWRDGTLRTLTSVVGENAH